MAIVEQNDVDIAAQRLRERGREPELLEVWVRRERKVDVGARPKAPRHGHGAEDPDLVKPVFRRVRVEPRQQIGQDTAPLGFVRRAAPFDRGFPEGELWVSGRHKSYI